MKTPEKIMTPNETPRTDELDRKQTAKPNENLVMDAIEFSKTGDNRKSGTYELMALFAESVLRDAADRALSFQTLNPNAYQIKDVILLPLKPIEPPYPFGTNSDGNQCRCWDYNDLFFFWFSCLHFDIFLSDTQSYCQFCGAERAE